MISATYRPLKDGPREVGQKGSKLLGLASVVLTTGEGEDFVISGVKVLEAADGHAYVQMPAFNVARQGDEAKWVEPAHPITTGGRAAMEAAIMDAKTKAEAEAAQA